MIVKNVHEKLLASIQGLLIDTKAHLPYYGEFLLHVNFHENPGIGTCAVNVTNKGMNFFYAPKFLEKLPQNEVNFITIHEIFHLLFDHPRRTITGQYDHKLSNIAQDMIINHVIWEDISHHFIEIPKNPDGKNMTLFVPKEYEGKLIFEELYEWLREEKEKWDKSQKKNSKCQSCNGTGEEQSDKSQPGDGNNSGKAGEEKCPDCDGSGNQEGKDSSGKPGYGPYGKNPQGKDKNGTLDTWSKEQIFQDMEKNEGQYMDVHIGDDIPESMRDAMVRDVMDRLASRGLVSGNVEKAINKLRKKRKDYLKEIKRSVSNIIFGTVKQKTIVKPNRRGISGLKGNRKVKTKINVILDTSGSMGGQGTFERVLSYVYRNDIEVNMIQGDTNVKWVENFKNKRKLETMKIVGLGGTVIQPSVNYVVDHFNDFNTVILTDGFCDNLDISQLRGKVLMISVGVKVPIAKSNGKIKQIVLDGSEKN